MSHTEDKDRIREVAAGRPPKPKRVYKTVEVKDDAGGFAIMLDGRTARTPKRQGLVLPTRALAEAIAAEWDAQEHEVDATTMPLTRLANTSIDGVSETMDAVLEFLFDYARADLLCYRVAYPKSLVRQQSELWQPVLDWAENHLGIRMIATSGIVAVEQPVKSIAALREAFARYGHWQLTAAHGLAGTYKSVILALAVMEGRLSAAEAHKASCLDEDFQSTIWGEDAEARKRAETLGAEAEAAATFAVLSRS